MADYRIELGIGLKDGDFESIQGKIKSLEKDAIKIKLDDNTIDTQIKNIETRLKKLDGIKIDLGNSIGFDSNTAIKSAQQVGQKIGTTITKDVKKAIDIDDVIDQEVLNLMKTFSIAGDKGSNAFKEIRQALVECRNELQKLKNSDFGIDAELFGTSQAFDKVTVAVANQMRAVNSLGDEYVELAKYMKSFNDPKKGNKVRVPDFIKQEQGDDYKSSRGTLGIAFNTEKGISFASFIEDLNHELGIAIDLTKGEEKAYEELVGKLRLGREQLEALNKSQNSLQANASTEEILSQNFIDRNEIRDITESSIDYINATEAASSALVQSSTQAANIVVQNEERIQQAYRGTSSVIENLKTTLESMRVDRSSIDTIVKDMEELGFTAKNASVEMKNGKFDITVNGIDDIGRAITEIRRFDNATDEISLVGRKISQPLAESDKFIKQQKKSVADLTNQINQLNRSAVDQNASRPIKDTSHLDALSSKYDEITVAIQRMENASSDTFVDEQNNVKKLIFEFKSLVSEFKNAENVSNKMKGTDFASGLDIAKNDLEKFKAQAKDFPQITGTIKELDKAIEGVGDAASLNKFNDQLRVARSELAKVKAETIAANRSEKVGIDVSGITSQIANIQRISPEIDKFETEIDGAKVSVRSLLDDLSKVNTSSDFSVVRARFKAFEEAAEAAGIAIREIAKNAKTVNEIKIKLNDTGFNGFEQEVQRAHDAVLKLSTSTPQLETALKQLDNAMKGVYSAEQSSDVQRLISANEKYENSLKQVNSQLKLLQKEEEKAYRAEMLSQKKAALNSEMEIWLKENTRAAKDFGEEIRRLQASLNGLDDSGVRLAGQQFKNLTKQAQVMGKTGLSVFDKLKSKAKEYAAYLSAAEIFMYAEQAFMSMFEQVKLIDSAMTELRKVTDETEASYNSFLTNAASKAKEIGTTIDGLIESTTDFARLGYDFTDAQGLAEVANIYAVVGDEIEGVEGATESLISTMAAFKGEMNGMSNTDFAMSIIDRFNEIGNNFSISSGGIGEALERSASSLMAANNTIDESIALITAANSVVQSPEQVGNAFKTISMRIRGAKTELEDAGLETEGMVESTAKLRSEILALSGVDIMENATEFKSTYKIMDELAAKWQDLSDIQQATVTELIAGKRQGNIVSSLMANFDTARDALETSMNSAGSAMREHEKWQQSLEARILSLKSSWQGLSQAFLSSDFLKTCLDGVINLVDGFTKLIDTLGAFPTIMGTIATGMSVFKNTGFFSVLNKDVAGAQKQLALFGKSFKDISRDMSSGQGLLKSLFNKSITKADVGYITEYFNQVKSGVPVGQAYANTLSHASVAGKQMAVNIKKGTASMSGLKTATTGGKLALFGLEAAATAANAALTMGLSIAIQLVVEWISKLINAKDDLAEKVDEITSKFKEQHQELAKLKGDYDTSNESSMISRYAKLSKGVDGLGRNVSLTAEEYSEYQDIVSTIADQIPSLVSGYDSQGNAILSCAGNVDQLTAAYEKLIKAQNDEVLVNSAGDINKDFKNALKDAEHDTAGFFGWNWTKELGWGDSKLSMQSAEIYENILNSADAIKEFNKAISTGNANDLESFLDNSDVDAMSELLEAAGFEKEGDFWSGKESNAEHIRRALEEDKSKVKNIIDQYYADLEEEAEAKKAQAQAALSNAFDLSDSMYYGMSDTMKNIAQQTVGAFDFKFFADLEKQGISVENYVNNMLDQLNAIGDSDEASIEAAFNLKTQFNSGDISYGEYVDGLENAGKLIDKLGLNKELTSQIKLSLGLDEEGLVENYQTLLNRLTETSDKKIASGNIIGLDLSEAEKLLNDLSSEELSVMTQILPEIDANATREQIEAAIKREMVLQGLTFDLNLEVEAAGIEALNTALTESVTASGLSSDSISALKGRYADLEAQGYDLSSMFEETSHGIHINRNELSKFENELSKQKLAEVDADLNEMKSAYDELGEAIKNCDDPLKKSELYNERQSLAQKISECATLASQYKGLTSAYNDWLAAESAGNERDMYENVITGFETVKDELSRGWADDSTIEFLEMLTGRTDLASKSGKELKEVYDGLGKKIKDTTYSVKDFFTVDDEGNSTSKGVYNFLDAVGQLEEEAFGGKDVVKRDSKGNVISFDFELAGGDEAIAEALGVSEELVQIMVRAADDAGFVVSLDGTYKQLADLQNEAKAAADYLKEIGKTNFDFDFNTSSATNLKTQLEEANKVLDKFKDKDGNIDLNADGAHEAMTIVSTLQAKLDTVTQEKYGIGLTVEDDKYEDALESLQGYGRTVAALNQLEINPNVNAEEIAKLESDLDTYATELNNLPDDIKVEIGLVGKDGKTPLNDVDAIKKKAESGEVKIPTTLDIQTNMDKNLSDLRDLALLNSGLLNPDQEEAIKIRLGIEVDPEVNNPESVGDAIENTIGGGSSTHTSSSGVEHGGSGGTFTIEPKVDVNPEPEVDKESFGTKLWNGIKAFFGGGNNEVETGGDGQLKYRIGVDPEPEVKIEGAKEEVKKKTEEAIQSESGEKTTVEKEVELELKIGDYIDNLSEFEDVAKRISDLDEDISATVTANIEGNIFGTENISNLTEFAEGAKAIQDVKSSDVSVEVDYDSNLNQVEDLDKLLEFAKGAKELEGVKSSDVSVEAELQCEFNGGNLDSLAKFAESASKLENVKSSDVSVEVNLDGNLGEWKGNLEDLGTFAKNAKELDGVKDANVSIRVNLESEFNETDFDKLTEFVTNAKELQGVKDSDVSVSANLEGNLGENTNIDKLQTFADGTKLLQDLESKKVEVTANLYGNLIQNPNLYGIETFAENVEKLQDVKGKEIEVTTNLYGNLIDNPNLYSLDDFAEGAEKLQDSESKKVEITANLYGNLIQNPNLYSLDDFAEGAEALQDSESKKVEITTNLYGNLVGNPNLYSLDDFAEGAKALQDVDGKKVEITANLYGNLINNPNLYSLDDFADGAKDLQGVESKKINITTNLYGNLVGNPNLYNLETFANGAEELQGIESKNVRIDANLYGNLIGNGNLDNLGTFADRAKQLQGIGNVNVSVKANVDAASINAATTLLSKVANSGLFKDYSATVNVKAVVNEINDSKVQGYKAPPKEGKVKYLVDSSKVDSWAAPPKKGVVNYSAKVDALTDAQKHKTGTITYKANIVGLGPAAGTAHVSGSAKANGSTGRAFARGDWGIKGNGVALGGELGQELVVRDGKFFTIGDSGAEFFRYRKNDIVFNASQTASLFKYGGLKGANPRGKMLATGTAFAEGNALSSGYGGGFWTNSSTGQSYGSKSSDKESSSDKDFEEVIDWIEVILDRVERSIDKFDQQANNIYKSWSSRNSALQSQISEVSREINLQQQAYNRYMSAAAGVGLPSSWAAKVRNGTIDISTIKDEALAEKISSYEEWYNKALDCQDAIRELQEQESKLYAQRFENLQTQYDGILQGYEHTEAMLNEYISQAEEQGFIVSKKYYESLITNEKQNINALKQEQTELIAARDEAVASGKITKQSEEWYNMCSEIDSVTQAIEEGETSLLSYAKAMDEIDWSIFDLIQERISGVTEEADFLIELLSNKKLFDDNGKLTSQGSATLALHAQNYNTQMFAADELGAEVARLDKQIANDPFDQELINRRNELLAQQREMILSAEQSKESIKSLIEDGYNAELESLDERIQKYEESLDVQKDLLDYEKKVTKQSQNLANLRKELSSYENDTSEESKKRIQELKVSIAEAEDELAETQYDKYISDQSQLLDSLYEEYELLLNQRIDNTDALLSQAIENANANATSIQETLTSETDKVGITLSNAMNSIWSGADGSAKSVLTMYGEDFKSKSATIITTLNGIKSSVNSMVSSLNKEATTKTKANKTTTSAKKNPTASSSSSKKKTTTTTKKSSSGDGKPKIGDRVKYVSGQYYYDSQGKKPLGSHNKGEYVYITNINTRDWATHGYHISTGNKLGKGDLGWLKLNQLSGYASGKEKFYNDENAWTQEDGREFIVRPSDGAILTPIAKGDSILNATASGNIWNMANSPAEFIKENLGIGGANVPNAQNVNNTYTQHIDNVVFKMDNVKNYDEMLSAMQKDKNFENLILSMSIDRIAGRSKLAKGKSIR